MRRLLIFACLAFSLLAPTAAAAVRPRHPLPSDVYLDFAADGKLDRVYPKSVLRELIGDATLNQYGDPLMMMRVRRAARLQLAGVLPTKTVVASPTAASGPTPATVAGAAPSAGSQPAAPSGAPANHPSGGTRTSTTPSGAPARHPGGTGTLTTGPREPVLRASSASSPIQTRDAALFIGVLGAMGGGLLFLRRGDRS